MDPRVRKDDGRNDGGAGDLGDAETQRRDQFGLFPNRCAAAPLREVLVQVIVAATRDGALLSFCFL
jgi:hypothetical protein